LKSGGASRKAKAIDGEAMTRSLTSDLVALHFAENGIAPPPYASIGVSGYGFAVAVPGS
jgi:hypothetical protein